MPDRDTQYEYKSVKAIRGMANRAIARLEKEGWELESRVAGTVQSELTFRRRRTRVSKRRSLIAAGGLVAVGLIVTIGAIADDHEPTTTVAQPASSATSSQPAVPGSVETTSGPTPAPTPNDREAAERAKQEKAKEAAEAATKKKHEQAAQKAKAEKQKQAEKAAKKEKADEERQLAAEEADAKLTFANCPAMNRKFPHGVGKSGARDESSGRRVTTFTVNSHVYGLNRSSDRDGDGIACEKR